ncbi:MAG: serine/threonine protein kinase [Hyphomicrobiaceae bacterium]
MTDKSLHTSDPVDLHARAPLPPGTRLDHYVIRDVLGTGGFAVTYLAEHEVLGKRYAIKEYFPATFCYRDGATIHPTEANLATYNWGLERFTSEARALARFKHPAIVDVASIFEANGTAYIVLALEKGRALNDWLRQLTRPPSQNEIDGIVRPLLGALDEIHKHNLMHRDIAPDNIIIRDDGSPVLIDFGAAREAVRGRSKVISAIVKHGYSPPEQYSSRPELQGSWTDIYALAATLYRLVAGRMPAEAPDRMLKDDVKPVAELARAHYRPGFMEAIDWGLRLRIEDRPQSIGEWRRLLMREEPLKAPMQSPRELPDATAGYQPTSARVPSGGRAGTSLRPDISVIEAMQEEAAAGDRASGYDPHGVNLIGKTLKGLGLGLVAGGLFSILPASVFSSSCFADSCILSYLPICSLLGAIAGAVVGYRMALAEQATLAGTDQA